jgi:RNA polymerase sigma factor (sigma-70 family)
MGEQVEWQAFRPCDALVEQAIGEGAYREALEHLVRGYQRVIISYCRRQLGSLDQDGRAEEVAQEIFVTAYRVMPRKGPTPVRPWLFAIARRDCWRARRDAIRQDRLRHTHQEAIRTTSHRESPPASPEEELEHLLRSLDKLRKRERELLVQRFLQGETLERLARIYYCSESTIRDRISKARARLQTIYRQLTEES